MKVLCSAVATAEGGRTNPGQLFAAGYTACFQNAMHLVATSQGQLLAATHQVCPFSNATRGNIEVELIAE